MRKTLLLAAVCLSLSLVSCGQNKGDRVVDITVDTAQKPNTEIHSMKDSLSWAYGQYLALTLNEAYFDTAIDRSVALQAFAYTLLGGSQNNLTNEMAWDIAQYALAQYAMIKQHQAQSTAVTVDSLQNRYFEQLVKTNPNVHRKQVGDYAFYYEVLRPGKGPNAQYAQRIRFDYRSFKLLDGQPIDKTYGNRESIIHVVGTPMFPGLIEGFQLMNAGSLYRFYFPFQLAFGEQGTEGVIPPFTPVIYEIELHELYEY